MTFDLTFFALAIPAVLFAGISKGGFGSGAAFASSAILAIIFPPAVAIGVMLPLLILMDAGALRAFWRQWNWALSRFVILGALPGVALGAAFYRVANADMIRFILGVISIGFVFWQVANEIGWVKRRERPVTAFGGLVGGLTGGFTSFISHAGGPPVAVYLLSQKISKTTYQACSVLIFTVINLFKLVPYTFLGIFSADMMLAGLYLSPFALIGVWLGVKAHHRIPERAFFRLTYGLLTITGGKLIWDSLV